MATYDYYKIHQPQIPNIKTGSNWFFIRIDFSKQPCLQNDILKICEIKSGSILKCGFSRVTIPTNTTGGGAATLDIGTSSGGNEIDDAIDIDSGTDTWIRTDTLDDDGPIILTADDYLYAKVLDAAVDVGVVDIMLEVVIAGDADIDRWGDSIAEAN